MLPRHRPGNHLQSRTDTTGGMAQIPWGCRPPHIRHHRLIGHSFSRRPTIGGFNSTTYFLLSCRCCAQCRASSGHLPLSSRFGTTRRSDWLVKRIWIQKKETLHSDVIVLKCRIWMKMQIFIPSDVTFKGENFSFVENFVGTVRWPNCKN